MTDGKQQILDFLATQKMCVVSTVNDQTNAPEAAFVAFAVDQDLNVYFQTAEHTRKAANLQTNRHVAFVMGLSVTDMVTLQYEGNAVRLADQIQIADIKQLFKDKDSPAVRFLDLPVTQFYKVEPTWIGFSDYRAGKPAVIEIKDFS